MCFHKMFELNLNSAFFDSGVICLAGFIVWRQLLVFDWASVYVERDRGPFHGGRVDHRPGSASALPGELMAVW